MRAIFTLAGLTVREALRRRIYVGAFCIALLFLGLLLLPGFASQNRHGVSSSRRSRLRCWRWRGWR